MGHHDLQLQTVVSDVAVFNLLQPFISLEGKHNKQQKFASKNQLLRTKQAKPAEVCFKESAPKRQASKSCRSLLQRISS